MTPASILGLLVPEAWRLAVEALRAILAGNPTLAARRAEEAARRQGTRLLADAALRATADRGTP